MTMLNAREIAELKGCSEASVKRLIRNGQLKAKRTMNEKNRPKYLVLLEDLPTEIQEQYYMKHCVKKEVTIGQLKRNLDEYSADERDEIACWIKILREWSVARTQQLYLPKGEFDKNYAAMLTLEYPEMKFSDQILRRKYNAYKSNDYDGLLDKRGKSKKGNTKIDEDVWEAFLSFYLDQRLPSVRKCYEYTVKWIEQEHPELADDIPTYCTFTRHVNQDIPQGTMVLGRYGEKAYDDRCAPYIKRVYDNLLPNDVWIADNHTFDVMLQNEDGETFRLYLTAFLDARTGIFTGIYITDAPSSQASILALRNGIMKYGIPKEVYLDNGREFLTFDFGGLGHRKKRKDQRFDPPPIFDRLGIKMTNALVRNAKAKIIERRFLDIKNGLSKLFESYTGGSVAEKPEQLKFILKKGKAVLDDTFKTQVKELIEGYFNYQIYNGPIAEDRGKTKIQAYHEHMAETTKRVASTEDLNLMLMRSTRSQKVGRRGVHLSLYGATIDFWNHEFLQNCFGKEVYLRYDPEDLKEVRVYDLKDRYIMSVPTDNATILEYGANVEDVKRAMAETRKGKKLEKERMKAMINSEISNKTALEITLTQAKQNLETELEVPQYDIELQRAKEVPLFHKVEVSNIDRMLKNAEEHKGGHDNV